MELGVDEAEEAVPDGGGYDEEEKEGGKKTVAEVAVDGTAVPFEDDGDGDGEGVGRADPVAPEAPPPDADEARGVEVMRPPPPPPPLPPGSETGKATGTMGFSCNM